MQYLMGVDVGGSVAKAAIYDPKGKEICSVGRKLDTLTPKAEYCERDAAQIRECVLDAIREAVRISGISAADIAAIGVTGQANGLYMFDKKGNSVYPAILSSDMRAKNLIKEWNTDGTLEMIIPKTRQILWAGQTAALVAWFARNEPKVLDRADVFLTAKDYARYLLTGVFSLECTEASSTSLMDLTARRLSPEIFKKLGIEKYMDHFPAKVLESTEIGGHVTEECAARTGLIEGTPVIGGLIDTVASVISQGITEEDQMALVVGTWGVNAFITTRPLFSRYIFSAFYYCLPNYNLILDGSSTSAVNLEWLIRTVLKQNGLPFCGYDQINSMVDASDDHSSLLFLPFLYGTNANIDATGAFIGLKGKHGLPDLFRAVYEGVVFSHMFAIDRLLKFRDRPKTVRIAGGGARSDVWMQIFADAMGVCVEVPEAEELGAMGSAMAAGVSVGIFKDFYDASGQFTHIGRVFFPTQERRTYYEKKYHAYCKLIETLDPLWGDLNVLE